MNQYNYAGSVFATRMRILNIMAMRKYFTIIGLVLLSSFSFAQEMALPMDFHSAHENIKYLANDLIAPNPENLEGFSDKKLIKSFVTLMENEYVTDASLSDYVNKADSNVVENVHSTVWAIYFIEIGKDSSYLDFKLDQIFDKEGNELEASDYISTGKFEKEVYTYLLDDSAHDYYFETWGAISEIDTVANEGAEEQTVLANPLRELLNKKEIIPFDLPVDTIEDAIGAEAVETNCEDCAFPSIYEWSLENNIYFRVITLDDGSRIYNMFNTSNAVIKDVFLGFSIGETKEEILEEFKEERPQVQQQKSSQEDTLYPENSEYIVVEIDDFYVKFDFSNDRLFGLMIAEKSF